MCSAVVDDRLSALLYMFELGGCKKLNNVEAHAEWRSGSKPRTTPSSGEVEAEMHESARRTAGNLGIGYVCNASSRRAFLPVPSQSNCAARGF